MPTAPTTTLAAAALAAVSCACFAIGGPGNAWVVGIAEGQVSFGDDSDGRRHPVASAGPRGIVMLDSGTLVPFDNPACFKECADVRDTGVTAIRCLVAAAVFAGLASALVLSFLTTAAALLPAGAAGCLLAAIVTALTGLIRFGMALMAAVDAAKGGDDDAPSGPNFSLGHQGRKLAGMGPDFGLFADKKPGRDGILVATALATTAVALLLAVAVASAARKSEMASRME